MRNTFPEKNRETTTEEDEEFGEKKLEKLEN